MTLSEICSTYGGVSHWFIEVLLGAACVLGDSQTSVAVITVEVI